MAGLTASNPEINEKAFSINSSNDLSEKHPLSMTPDPNLPCLQPDFNPVLLQKIAEEGILLATGGLAILLQIANPGVGQGVNEHSNFAYRPVDRLRTTMTYIYCMAFGTVEEKKMIIEIVHRAHVPVKGASYTADDPELQLWVAATLYGCGLDIYEKIFGKLDDVTAEKVYQEYAVMATSLRVPAEMWPKTRKEFWAYWDENLEKFQISSHAKNVANDLLYNNHGPLWVRLNLPFVRAMTVQWLPPRMRAEYNLKNSKAKRGLYNVTMALGRTVYPHLPKFIRTYPLHHYMKDMRKRMKKMGEV